jgi:hypothetical protein
MPESAERSCRFSGNLLADPFRSSAEIGYTRQRGSVKRITGLFLVGFLAAGMACAKDWKTGAIIGVSQTKETSPMMREAKIVMHYTVVTDALTLQLDYAFHPPTKSDEPDEPGKNSPPSMALGGTTKVAVEGHHAYLLDVNGKEVKMAIKKKSKN